MIRIMIVDDMPIFLEYLRGCLDWNAYGFEICCEARDGRDAWEKIGEYYPDVVLTDITMPYVNGLELADRIMKNYPDISVILITGNNEFEYARRAVKIGVCDYIVKPFEKQELLLSLMKLQDNVNRAVELEQKEHRDERLRTENCARAVVYSKEQAAVDTAVRELGMSGENFLVCGIRFRADGQLDPEQLSNWCELIREILAGMIEIDGTFVIFRDYESHLMVLLNFNDRAAAMEFKGYEFTDLIAIIRNQLNVETSIVISDFCEDAFRLRTCFSQVLQTLRIKGPGQVWDCRKREYSRATMGPESDVHALDVVSAVIRDLHNLQAERIEEDIEFAWEAVGRNGTGMHLSYESLSSAILSILLTDIINAGISLKTLYGEYRSPEQMLAETMDPEERKQMLIDLCHRRIEYENEKKDKPSDDVVGNVIRYMEENLGNSGLSVTDMLSLVPVNQTYLRKMFKEETGKTLNEYLTSLRMEKAKTLIQNTQDKLADIAEQTGYTDVSYFSNCFKKYFGTSPKSLRAK